MVGLFLLCFLFSSLWKIKAFFHQCCLVDYNKFVIEILALDQNGIFQEFAKISNIQKFKKVDIVDTTIIISGQTQQTRLQKQ